MPGHPVAPAVRPGMQPRGPAPGAECQAGQPRTAISRAATESQHTAKRAIAEPRTARCHMPQQHPGLAPRTHPPIPGRRQVVQSQSANEHAAAQPCDAAYKGAVPDGGGWMDGIKRPWPSFRIRAFGAILARCEFAARPGATCAPKRSRLLRSIRPWPACWQVRARQIACALVTRATPNVLRACGSCRDTSRRQRFSACSRSTRA